MNCCDFHKLDCDQGDLCPLRKSCQAKRVTPLITANSDGRSTGHDDESLMDDTGLLICQGAALTLFAAVVACLLIFL